MSPSPEPAPAGGAHAGADHEARGLLQQIGAGDRVALETLYRANAGWLVARLTRRCGDPERVDIAVQDTFLVVWRNASSYSGTGDVGAWLWGIAIRKLIDQMRKRSPSPMDPSIVAHTGAPAFGSSASVDQSAEAEVFAARVGGDLGHAFAHLDADLQAVLLATAVDGLSTKEAAVLLGIPQGTVKTRLARARAHLQERLT